MSKLIFSSAVSQSGFTNASTSTSNDKDASVVIREILQNSFDSAIEEANNEVAKVKFIIDFIKCEEIPGIKEYKNALKLIEKEDFSRNEQELDILNVIREQLEEDEIPVLHIIDNGTGFNQEKLVAVLSDGISDKANPENSGGSYGNGHFSAYNVSNLRYVLYGGKINDDEKICSGQALLRTFKKGKKLKLGTGFLVTEDKSILSENDIFFKNESIPKIMNKQLDNMNTDSGAVVSILGFNFFGKNDNTKKVIDLISSSIVRNFFVAIREGQLEVEISSKEENCFINQENLDTIFHKTEKEKSNPIFNTAKRFYDVLVNGNSQIIETKEGDVKVYYKESEGDKKLALCRNGMWINDAIPSPLNRGQFVNSKPFSALVLPQKNTSLSKLIRRAEGNLHMDLKLNRFSSDKSGREKREKLQGAFEEIKDYLISVIGENDNDSFDVEIPELSINMIGSAKSEDKRQEKVPKTKKVKKRKKVNFSDEENGNNQSTGKGEKDKSNKKKRVGNPFSVAKFSSRHNVKDKEARVRFSIDKPSTNLLLCLRLDDGKDPTCDGYGKIDANNIYIRRLEIKNAFCNGIECDIINGDTIDIGQKKKNEVIDLRIEYDTNIKGNYTIDYEFLNSAKKDNK